MYLTLAEISRAQPKDCSCGTSLICKLSLNQVWLWGSWCSNNGKTFSRMSHAIFKQARGISQTRRDSKDLSRGYVGLKGLTGAALFFAYRPRLANLSNLTRHLLSNWNYVVTQVSTQVLLLLSPETAEDVFNHYRYWIETFGTWKLS